MAYLIGSDLDKYHKMFNEHYDWCEGNRNLFANPENASSNGVAMVYNHRQYAWYLDGLQHRLDGPAVVSCGPYVNTMKWFVNNSFHSVEGPALVTVSDNWVSLTWYLYGNEVKVGSQDEFERYLYEST